VRIVPRIVLGAVWLGAFACVAGRGDDAARAPAAAPEGAWDGRDWEIFSSRIRWADSAGLRALEPGRAIARLALSFVGSPYEPGTLEVDGPERVVIDFRAFDCVTFVENMLALERFIREDGVEGLADREAAERRYEGYLTDLRYRGGVIDGYPSRLHYFSEWLTDNESKGLVSVITGDLEPAIDREPIDFMSAHPSSYRQLAEPHVLAEIRRREARLNEGGGRRFVPQDRIAGIEDRIRDGDVIAATSTLPGLDIAHTGIALWIDGRLHLVHAPLVGSSVRVSEGSLAERVESISSQDGIMVARPR